MATVTKDFKVKNGIKVQGDANLDGSLYVGGPDATVNGSDIITEDIITGGTQTNIAVTYNQTTKTLDFVAENGIADSTTSNLVEGTNLYYTNERVDDRVGNLVAGGTGITVAYDDIGNAISISTDFTEFSTTDIVEGTKFFFTNERAQDAVGNSLGIGLTYADTTGAISVTPNTYDAFGAAATAEDNAIAYADALTTADIAEGTNLYFTDERAVAAVGGSATRDNVPNTVVKRDINGDFATENIFVENKLRAAIEVMVGSSGGTPTVIKEGEIVTSRIWSNSSGLSLESPFGDIVLDTPLGGAYITSVSAGNKIATNGYVDAAISGLAWKEAVHLFSTTNVPLTGLTQTVVIDSHSVLDSTDTYRLLLTGQTDPTENGIYLYADNGTSYTLTRAEDSDTVPELTSAAVFVMEGTIYGTTSWVQSNHYATAFDDLVWIQFSGTGAVTAGEGISITGTAVSVDRTTLDTWYVDVSGDTMSGNLAMSNHNVTGLGTPSAVDHAANKGYVDGEVSSAIAALTTEDIPELISGATNFYFTNSRAVSALEAVVPNFTEIEYNSVAKQVAATAPAPSAIATVIYAFNKTAYRSAEFLIKLAYSTHTEVSKVVVTLDSSDNVAITEYAIVGTNGSLSEISATVSAGNVQLIVTPVNDSTVVVVGTLLA